MPDDERLTILHREREWQRLAGTLEQIVHNRLTMPQYVGVLGQGVCLARQSAELLRTAADHVSQPDLPEFLRLCARAEASHAALAEQDLQDLGKTPPPPGRASRRLVEQLSAVASSDHGYRVLGFLAVWGRVRAAIRPDKLIPEFGNPPRRYLDSLAEAEMQTRRLEALIAGLAPELRGEVAQTADACEQQFIQFLIEAATMTGVVIAPGRAAWSSRLPAPRDDEASAADPAASGLIFHVASTVDEIVAAWRMVYRAYLQAGLIQPNAHRMHASPQVIHANTVVIYGSIRSVVVSTMSAFTDFDAPHPQLPLDRVFGPQLDAFRQQGRRLMEVGLFADRRQSLARTAQTLFQLMRFAFHFGVRQQITDFVIGVHPRHARFYMRSFGFETIGQAATYAAVNNNPVVLLRGDIREQLSKSPLHPALQFFVDHPVATDMFDQRVRLSHQAITGSPIEAYLNDYAKPLAA